MQQARTALICAAHYHSFTGCGAALSFRNIFATESFYAPSIWNTEKREIWLANWVIWVLLWLTGPLKRDCRLRRQISPLNRFATSSKTFTFSRKNRRLRRQLATYPRFSQIGACGVGHLPAAIPKIGAFGASPLTRDFLKIACSPLNRFATSSEMDFNCTESVQLDPFWGSYPSQSMCSEVLFLELQLWQDYDHKSDP